MSATPRADRLLPTGTVTFLFTDIEGSTLLWETQHAAMQQALAHHDATVRHAIETNGGVLVKTTGDGAHAVFAIAANAIAACLAAQRGLKAQAWGGLCIKSRMALHSGAAELRDGDYYGPALNRGARLMAAGHGGQILLSRATEELLRDHLPANIALRDMGERRLKDLIQSERVFQVIAPDLPVDFPPLKTLDARPNNLPAQTTPFIGRQEAIRAVKEQLSNANVRLLSLSGVGGTGKTRLALQAAADMVDEFEHGVFFVPLAALSDPRLVLPTIAQAFDVREAADRPLQVQIQDYLREKQILLVLDNFEQVIDAAPRISDLLTAAPRLKVLVTSREVLRLSGETDYPVPPLSLPDPKRMPPLEQFAQYEAVALFIERAVAVKAVFKITNVNALAVAEVCYRLDGLPLAIELAAARVRVLPPQQMLAQLGNRLRFLTSGARDLPTRQQTLRGMMDWSYGLLTDSEKRMFRQLAVFVGGCTPVAAESICNADGQMDVLSGLQSLLDKNLLRQTEVDGEARFSMLETIREYAREKLLESGENESVRARHLNAFLQFAEDAAPQVYGPDQMQWLQRVESEHDNLRAALSWAIGQAESVAALRLSGALGWFWFVRGHLSEGRQWLQQTFALGGRATDMTMMSSDYRGWHAKALQAGAKLAEAQGDYATTQALSEESLVLFRALGNRRGIALSLHWLGIAAFGQGDYATARVLHEECLALYRELRDKGGIGFSLNCLGMVATGRGDFTEARALHEESLALFRELGDKRAIAISLDCLGMAASDRGDFSEARALHEESLALFRELGDKKCIAECLPGFARVAQAGRQPQRATRLLGAVEALLERIGARLDPTERADFDRTRAAARAQLDQATFSAAWEAGRAMTLEDAIDYALGDSA